VAAAARSPPKLGILVPSIRNPYSCTCDAFTRVASRPAGCVLADSGDDLTSRRPGRGFHTPRDGLAVVPTSLSRSGAASAAGERSRVFQVDAARRRLRLSASQELGIEVSIFVTFLTQ